MKLFITLLFFLPVLCCAERITLDPDARSFEMKSNKKVRLDTFDFAGIYTELENIFINAHKKKNVELLLTGEYPNLKIIDYQGSFGVLNGQVTGKFPKLTQLNVLCGNCAMTLDLKGEWQNSISVKIQGGDEDIHLLLPDNIGVIVHTKTTMKGKVLAKPSLHKKKRLGILNKVFENDLVATANQVLTVTIECQDGRVFLN